MYRNSRGYLLGLFFLLLTTCTKEEFEIQNLENNAIICLGHGGMGVGDIYPMNSYESIQKCLTSGMDGSEIDVQMTKDGVLVAYHDFDLSASTTLNGLINDLTWNEVKQAQYTQTLYLDYSIMSLDELFQHTKSLSSYKFTFDCKLYSNNKNQTEFKEQYIQSLITLVDKYDMEQNVYIESQDELFLKEIQQRKPQYKLFIYPENFETGLDIAKRLDLYGITISTNDISKDQISEAHKNNKRVAIWNIHSKSSTEEAIKKNPDMIQADKVNTLLKLLK